MKALFLISCTLVLLGMHATFAAPEGLLAMPYDLILEDEPIADEIQEIETENLAPEEIKVDEVLPQINEDEIPEEPLVVESIQQDDMELLNEQLSPIIDEIKEVPVEDEDDEDEDEYEEDHEDTQEEMEMKNGIPFQVCQDEPEDNWHPIHLSHPTDCTKFYKCFNGRGFLMNCPSREHWSVILDRCDYPKMAKCVLDGDYKTKHKSNKSKSQALPMAAQAVEGEDEPLPEIDPRCPADGDPYKPQHLGHPTDCTKFYKCYLGRAYVIKCPRGQQWFRKMSRCDHPAVAKCVST